MNLIFEWAISKLLAIWLFAWLAVVGGAIYLLPEPQVELPGSFNTISLYYLAFVFIGSYFYKLTRIEPHQVLLRTQVLQIVVFSAAVIGICLGFEAGLPVAEVASAEIIRSKFYFPLFKGEILLTKFFDISFQQVFINGIIRQLKMQKVPDIKILQLFAVGFFLVHLPLLFSLGLTALYFIGPSLFAGIIFSYLILKLKNGIFISFAVHFSFYLMIGLWLRYV